MKDILYKTICIEANPILLFSVILSIILIVLVIVCLYIILPDDSDDYLDM